MAIQCPVCEEPNADDALECARCGRQLLTEGELEAGIEPVPDIDHASFAMDTALTPDLEQLPELEPTHYAPAHVAIAERVAVESTLQERIGEVEPMAQPADLETGREADDGSRTLPPEQGETCPFCGAASTGKICDGCGRRKARYTAAPGTPTFRAGHEPQQEVCPHCFAKVFWAVRCPECGVRMRPRE